LEEYPSLEIDQYYDTFLCWDDVDRLSTKQIIKNLKKIGINFSKKRFISDTHSYFTSIEIVDEWKSRYSVKLPGKYFDFVYYAVRILWNRLAPNVVNFDNLFDTVSEGYNFFKKNYEHEACEIWMDCWEKLKSKLSPEIQNIERINEIIEERLLIKIWFEDLFMALANSRMYDKIIEIGREVLHYFPNSDNSFIHHTTRNIANAFFLKGQEERGEEEFSTLVTQFPNNIWGYLEWGDKYANFRKDRFNAKKAKNLFQKALKLEIEPVDEEFIKIRLKDLEINVERHNLMRNLMEKYEIFLSKNINNTTRTMITGTSDKATNNTSAINAHKGRKLNQETDNRTEGIEKNIKEMEDEDKMKNTEAVEGVGDMGDVEEFIRSLLTYCSDDMEELVQERKFDPDFIINFLGGRGIYYNIIQTKQELMNLYAGARKFVSFLTTMFDEYSEDEIEEFAQVLNSKDFFLRQLDRYNDYKEIKQILYRKYRNDGDLAHLKYAIKPKNSLNDWWPSHSDWRNWYEKHKAH